MQARTSGIRAAKPRHGDCGPGADRDFVRGILEIRQRILKGDFAEPVEASMMLWSPRESAVKSGQHSSPNDKTSTAEQEAFQGEETYYSSVGPPPECDYSAIMDVPAYFYPACGSQSSSSASACPVCWREIGSRL
jgi:hypothetical protein